MMENRMSHRDLEPARRLFPGTIRGRDARDGLHRSEPPGYGRLRSGVQAILRESHGPHTSRATIYPGHPGRATDSADRPFLFGQVNLSGHDLEDVLDGQPRRRSLIPWPSHGQHVLLDDDVDL